ncbi:MAG: hypothetical protein DRI70_06610 [Bacteroidetes bacterium]|nr:MAG: hypothetical protein DRI70_06610 [Bacteroidota bacterium]
MEENKTNCKNCEREFQEDFEFCPYCGQKAKDDLTMGVLFYNTISNYFSFDARFFRSFLPLMFRPGYLAKRFVGGKRLLYLHPAQYYLFVSVMFFFLFSFQAREYTQKVDRALKKGFESDTISAINTTPIKILDSVSIAELTEPLKDKGIITGMDEEELRKLDSIIKENANTGDITNLDLGYDKKKLDSLIAVGAPEAEQLKAMGMNDDAGFLKRRLYTQLLKFQKNSGGGILQAFFDSIPIALFVLLPIFAFILKIFFWRRGSFAHHLVFSFYFFSFLFVVLGIILVANYIWDVPFWIGLLIALSTYFYLLIAIRHFYRQNYFLTFLKTGMVTFIYLMFVLPIALGIMVATSFLFY